MTLTSAPNVWILSANADKAAQIRLKVKNNPPLMVDYKQSLSAGTPLRAGASRTCPTPARGEYLSSVPGHTRAPHRLREDATERRRRRTTRAPPTTPESAAVNVASNPTLDSRLPATSTHAANVVGQINSDAYISDLIAPRRRRSDNKGWRGRRQSWRAVNTPVRRLCRARAADDAVYFRRRWKRRRRQRPPATTASAAGELINL